MALGSTEAWTQDGGGATELGSTAGPGNGKATRQQWSSDGTAAAVAPGSHDVIAITINREKYEVRKQEMAAKEIRDMAGAPPNHVLILVVGEQGKASNGDEPMADDDTVRLAPGMRFRTINSATFGSQVAANIPPLLQDHMVRLE